MRDYADAAIDGINSDFPGHEPGTRPIHAPGITATGWFEANPVASRYTDAEHFAGPRVPVTVRFSNGTGLVNQPDSVPVVRGMSVRFHLGDVTTDEHGVLHGTAEADLIGMSLNVFFVKTPDLFLEFLRAAAPAPVPVQPGWRKVLDALSLRTPLRPPKPGDAGLVAFANRHPPARLGLISNGSVFVPESYATISYHPVHAYALVAGSATTWARFDWEPVSGVRPAPAGVQGDFLHQELRERLARGPAEFVLRMQVAEQGDDTADPTMPWPKNGRKRIVMGHLWVGTLVADQVNGGELLSFDPTRVVPGIEVSDDEILQVRHEVYERSFARRSAERTAAGA